MEAAANEIEAANRSWPIKQKLSIQIGAANKIQAANLEYKHQWR
jgi:hypothetical protein